MVGDEIHLQAPNNGETSAAEGDAEEELERHTLEKYTFSNALALSGNFRIELIYPECLCVIIEYLYNVF